MKANPAPSSEALAAEIGAARLKDVRLARRAALVVAAVAESPGDSFPQIAATDGELEGLYRLLGNERVNAGDLLEPHFVATGRRAMGNEPVLVVQDSSLFNFPGHREGLGRIPRGHGFLGHFALAVASDGSRCALGLLGLTTIFRRGPKSETKESKRWEEMVETTERRLKGMADAVHVMDREADIWGLLAQLEAAKHRFIIRAAQDRYLMPEVTEEKPRLWPTLEQVQGELLREVPLSPRKPYRPKNDKVHPPRDARMASLHVRAAAVTFKRPRKSVSDALTVVVNAVHVYEPNPPEGEAAIDWMLLTSEPISSLAELTRIIDWYRARWVIEEYFKALKTGCAYEKRQLESAHALLNTLAILAPVAWRLLLLRSVARTKPGLPARRHFSVDELALLRSISRRVVVSENPNIQDVLLAIAGLGGHLKRNGPPGWQTIGRGYDKFSAALAGWRAHAAGCDQS